MDGGALAMDGGALAMDGGALAMPGGFYAAVVPPSMTSSEPVTKDDSSDAR